MRDNNAAGGGIHCSQITLVVDAAVGPLAVTSPNTAVNWNPGSQTITWDVHNTLTICGNVIILMSLEERAIINRHLAKTVQERYVACQKLYQVNGISPVFKTFENVGHWTTSDVNLAVILFFLDRRKGK